ALTTSQTIDIKTQAQKAQDILDQRLPSSTQAVSELLIVKSSKYKVTSTEFKQFTLNLQKNLQDLGKDKVTSTVSYYQSQNQAFLSKSGAGTIVIVNMKGDLEAAEKVVPKFRDLISKNNNSDFKVYESGVPSINKDFQDLAE